MSTFDRARRLLATAHESHGDLCEPFVSALPVEGAALSVLAAGANGNSTICASDAIAARLDELQFDLGEGPCWDAMATRSPILRPDTSGARNEWPVFGEALESDAETAAVASVFAFPLAVGSLEIGAVDLYSTIATDLAADQVEGTTTLANLAAWQVLRRVLGEANDEPVAYSRREVHQATGMLIVQLDVTLEEAGLLLRAHAFAAGRSVRELAADVVARRIDFSTDGRADTPRVGS